MRALWRWLNAHAGWLFVGGLGAVALWNWRKWRQDRALALRLRASQREPPALGATPRVSVLVAAWNEAAMIRRHIESFLALRYPDKELILCAGGTDGTYEIARCYSGEQVRVLEQRAGEGKQRALRQCLAHASGDIIWLTDGDCVLDDVPMSWLLAPVASGREQVASGSRRPLDEQRGRAFVAYQWYYHAYCAARAPAYVDGLEGRNSAIRRGALETVGGFDSPVPIGTDYYLACKLLARGYRIAHVPESQVATRHAERIRDYWRQHSRWQRNIVLHGVRFGNLASVWRTLQTGFVGVVMLCLPAAAFLRQWALVVLWAVLAVQGLFSRVRYMASGRPGQQPGFDFSLRWHLLSVYMFADFVAWALGMVESLVPWRRWKW